MVVEKRAATQLDELVPIYQFQEFHSIKSNAPPDRIYQAIKQVTADEIRFFRILTWMRRAGRPMPEGILNVPRGQPILEVALRTGFFVLAEKPGHEIVLGAVILPPYPQKSHLTPQEFRALRDPGLALAAINFQVSQAGVESLLSTETRVYATDDATQRKFRRYWRVIHPGSALIRRMWLRAIKTRAERGFDSTN